MGFSVYGAMELRSRVTGLRLGLRYLRLRSYGVTLIRLLCGYRVRFKVRVMRLH